MVHTDAGQCPSIVVTGVTGHLGGRIARRLAAAGTAARLLARDVNRAPKLPNTDVRAAGYRDRGRLEAVCRGADIVLMVSASETPDRVEQHVAFVDAVRTAGVGHLVYVSFVGAAPDAVFTLARDHWATEEHIRRSGLAFTFLRDNLYADFMPELVGPDGVIRGPAGAGRVAVIGQDDIADAACAVLRNPRPHRSQTYDLCGPQALTLREVAAELSPTMGATITYRNESIEEAYASRAASGAPQWQLDAWVSTYTAIAAGALERTTHLVEALTGRPATPLAGVLARSVSRPGGPADH